MCETGIQVRRKGESKVLGTLRSWDVEPDRDGNRNVVVDTKEGQCTMMALELEGRKPCSYCGKAYWYNLGLGDCNMGACNRHSCILASMREHM